MTTEQTEILKRIRSQRRLVCLQPQAQPLVDDLVEIILDLNDEERLNEQLAVERKVIGRQILYGILGAIGILLVVMAALMLLL